MFIARIKQQMSLCPLTARCKGETGVCCIGDKPSTGHQPYAWEHYQYFHCMERGDLFESEDVCYQESLAESTRESHPPSTPPQTPDWCHHLLLQSPGLLQ